MSKLLIFVPIIFRIPYIIDIVDYWYLCPDIQLTCFGSIKKCAQNCVIKNPGLFIGRLLNKISLPTLKYIYGLIRVILYRLIWRRLLNCKSGLLLPVSEKAKFIYSNHGIKKKLMLVQPWGIKDLNMQKEPASVKNKIIIGYMGAVFHPKGAHILISALKKITLHNIELHIYGFFGNDQYRNYLNELKNKDSRVKFCGKYYYNKIQDILKDIDILVVPSVWEEVYGLVIQEGFKARIPIIASQIGGIEERVINSVNGFLVKPNDKNDLADKLYYVIKNYSLIKTKLNYLLSEYTIEEEVKSLLNIYNWFIYRNNKKDGAIEFLFKKELKYLFEFFNDQDNGVILKNLAREYDHPGITVRKSWNTSKPETEKEILNFYKTTDSYIYDLICVHKTWERIIWTKVAIEIFKKYKVKNILDFGGGVGDDTIKFHKFNFNVTLFELDSLTAKFVKFRLKKENIDTIQIETNPKKLGVYDGIYCTEVLEHLSKPFDMVRSLIQILNKGGILIITHSFELTTKEFPTHLLENKKYAKDFPGRMTELGLNLIQKIPVPGDNYFYIFKK